MARKSMADKLKQTTVEQQKSNQDRFERANTVMLKEVVSEPSEKPVPAKKKEVETKLVRDGFLMPENDYKLIKTIIGRLARKGHTATKTQVYRAALHALDAASDDDLVALFDCLETVRRGRPGV